VFSALKLAIFTLKKICQSISCCAQISPAAHPCPYLWRGFDGFDADFLFKKIRFDPSDPRRPRFISARGMAPLQESLIHRQDAKNAKKSQVFPLRISAHPLCPRRLKGFLQ